MSKHHYVYKSFEEGGREYIGRRTCDCLPEEDIKYFGSFRDKTFNPTGKIILFTGETRQEVAEIEIELHDFFDVAVNPQFANKAKATSAGFDRTGVLNTEEHIKKVSEANSGKTRTEETKKRISESKSGENNPMYGVPQTEAQKKAKSKRMSGENNPMYGVPQTEEWKKAHSERVTGEKNPWYGKTGAAHNRSKAIIAIEPDGTQRHFGSGHEAARDLEMNQGTLCYYLKIGHVLKCGKLKGWSFRYENSEVLN
jgi:group I intron endonuclease